MPTLVESLSLVAALVATVTGVVVLRRRRTSPLALPLGLMLLGASEWAAARALLAVADGSVGATVALHLLVYPGVALVVPAAYWYVVVLSGRRLTRRAASLLWVHPVLLAVAVATQPWHGAFVAIAVDGTEVTVGAGPLYWIHTAYSYAMLTLTIAISLRAMVRAVPGHRRVYAVAALGAAIPFLGNVITVVVAAASGARHLTPVFLLVSATMWLWVERRGGLTRVVPVSTRQVLRTLSDAVVVLDPDGRVLDANPAAHALLVRRERGAHAEPDDGALAAVWRSRVAPDLADLLAAGGTRTLTTTSGPRAGAVLDVRVTHMTDPAGRPAGAVVVLRDVTELERLRTELAHQATHDALTGVHNRRSFEVLLATTVDDAHAHGTPLSVVLVDLDHFKVVNDTHGHAVGDRVLVEVCRALTAVVSTALPAGAVARLGGEELVLLLPGLGAEAAAGLAEEARTACAAVRVPVRGGEVGVTISAGVAEVTSEGSADDVLRRADRAMYEAKAAGRDHVALARGAVLPAAPGNPAAPVA